MQTFQHHILDMPKEQRHHNNDITNKLYQIVGQS